MTSFNKLLIFCVSIIGFISMNNVICESEDYEDEEGIVFVPLPDESIRMCKPGHHLDRFGKCIPSSDVHKRSAKGNSPISIAGTYNEY